MGTSPGLGVSEAHSKMRAFAFVLLAAVAINADADADAYTIGQVAHGLTHGGVVTGVYGAHHGIHGVHGVSHVAGAHPVNTVAGVYNAHHAVATPTVHSVYSGLRHHLYGKREADAEPEAEPLLYTNSLVHHAGVSHVAGVHPVHTVAGVYNTHHAVATPAVHTVATPAVHIVATPAVHTGVHHVA